MSLVEILLQGLLLGLLFLLLRELMRDLGDLYTESGQTLQGSFSAGWLAGKPDYLQKLKVPEGYEKINDYSNI